MSTEFLSTLRASGVELWADDGQLRYRAPAGVMTDEVIGQLRASKAEMLSLLESADIERMSENALEHFTERAAIGEFDGGLSRTKAERQAAGRVFEYQLIGWPSHQWGILLMQPGDTLTEDGAWCRERFGGKFVAARPYRPGRNL